MFKQELTTNTNMPYDPSKSSSYLTDIILIYWHQQSVRQCVNHCLTPIFNGSTMCKSLTIRFGLYSQQAIFSRWTWSIRNFTTRILTYLFCPARNHSANAMTSSSQHYAINSWIRQYSTETTIVKPNFHSRSVFSENPIAIKMRKFELKFDKPIYVGMYILDISKTCLYDFHHVYIAPPNSRKL